MSIDQSTKSAMQAQNLPVDSGHFDIEINVLDDEGESVRRLSEFGSTIVSWSFEAAPPPPFDDDDGLLFDDEEDEPKISVGPGGKMTKPTLDKGAEDEEEDEVDDEEDDPDGDDADYADDYRELVLTHQVTGAAFAELNKWVFDQSERPQVSVKIEYYAEVPTGEIGPDNKPAVVKHPIFTHMFYGIFYVPEDISGNRSIGGQKQGPLLLVTKMEVLGSKVYGDPDDTDMLARILQEYAANSAH